MNHKVLLADDSLTIQKVIKITLANQPYEIIDAGSEDELFKKLSETNPKIIFLDFNLSDKHTGYELTSKIKEISPKSKVLLLLGTFDSVDESTMSKCGASDKIVKPFDSNKFIAICRRLIEEDSEVEEISFPEPKVETKNSDVEDDSSQWEMQNPKKEEVKVEQPKPFDVKAHLNPLDEEVNSWGMSVPGVISGIKSENKVIDLPPVMNNPKMENKAEVTSIKEHREAKAEVKAVLESVKYPDNTDLDYPTIEELTEKPAPQSTATTSKLISIETFSEANFEIEHGINTADETDISKLEALIRDEVEEDIWKVDEFEDLKKEVEAKFEEARSSFTPTSNDFDESILKKIDEEMDFTSANVQSEFDDKSPGISNAQVEELVKKYVKEYLDAYFKQSAEKVAWEVIPDLAENLIRQELTKISNRVLDE